jgi:hypothetical protein
VKSSCRILEEVRKTEDEDVLWIPEHVGGVKSEESEDKETIAIVPCLAPLHLFTFVYTHDHHNHTRPLVPEALACSGYPEHAIFYLPKFFDLDSSSFNAHKNLCFPTSYWYN